MTPTVVIPWARSEPDPWRNRNLETVLAYYERFFPGWPVDLAEGDWSASDPLPIGELCNQAVARAPSDFIVFNWADCLANPAALTNAVHVAEWCPSMVKPYDSYLRLSEKATERLTFDTLHHYGPGDCVTPPVPAWGLSALVVTSKRAYEELGGYDPRFRGWGYEDFALELVHEAVYGDPVRVPGNCYHLWHGYGFQDDAQTDRNRALYEREYEANRGDREALLQARDNERRERQVAF